jgi:hypothetical protein
MAIKRWRARLRYVTYNYDTIEDMDNHIEYMLKNKGVTLYESDDEYLYAEFEIENLVESSDQLS